MGLAGTIWAQIQLVWLDALPCNRFYFLVFFRSYIYRSFKRDKRAMLIGITTVFIVVFFLGYAVFFPSCSFLTCGVVLFETALSWQVSSF